MKDTSVDPVVSSYMSDLGKKGGKTKGKSKSRGDSEHYRKLAAMRKNLKKTDKSS